MRGEAHFVFGNGEKRREWNMSCCTPIVYCTYSRSII
jgi:hypothetical protein